MKYQGYECAERFKNHCFRGKYFCFYYMFKTKCDVTNRHLGGTKNFMGNCHYPQMFPVATGL